MNSKLSALVIGYGQIGKALVEILDCEWLDKGESQDKSLVLNSNIFDIIHICFGYSETFIEDVKAYQKQFKPKFTIIHSTVPVGTSRQLNAIHSPVVGIHPHLAKSIKTFTKFLGGEDASEVANYFRTAGCKVYLFDKQETTELLKLSQTTYYALTIEYYKDLKRQCDKLGLSYSEVMTIPATDYNRGYEKLGMPEIKIPLLIPIMTKQGGHCTIPNCGLWTTDFTEFIKQMNHDA